MIDCHTEFYIANIFMIYSHSQSYIEYMDVICSHTEYFTAFIGMIYCHTEYYIASIGVIYSQRMVCRHLESGKSSPPSRFIISCPVVWYCNILPLRVSFEHRLQPGIVLFQAYGLLCVISGFRLPFIYSQIFDSFQRALLRHSCLSVECVLSLWVKYTFLVKLLNFTKEVSKVTFLYKTLRGTARDVKCNWEQK